MIQVVILKVSQLPTSVQMLPEIVATLLKAFLEHMVRSQSQLMAVILMLQTQQQLKHWMQVTKSQMFSLIQSRMMMMLTQIQQL